VNCIIVANVQYVLLDTIYYNNVQYNAITTTEEMINYDSILNCYIRTHNPCR